MRSQPALLLESAIPLSTSAVLSNEAYLYVEHAMNVKLAIVQQCITSEIHKLVSIQPLCWSMAMLGVGGEAHCSTTAHCYIYIQEVVFNVLLCVMNLLFIVGSTGPIQSF